MISSPETFTDGAVPALAGRAETETTPRTPLPLMPQTTGNPATPSESKPVAPSSPSIVVEKHYRSLLKAVSWRATGTLDTIIISFLITGKVKLAVSIGIVEVFTKIGLFYLHERLWNKIPLGRARAQEDYTI